MKHYSVVRRPGAAAVDLAMVAAGWIGVAMGFTFKPWDVAAGIHLVKVAGGHVLNLPLATGLPEGLRPAIVASVGTLDAHTARAVLEEVAAALGIAASSVYVYKKRVKDLLTTEIMALNRDLD